MLPLALIEPRGLVKHPDNGPLGDTRWAINLRENPRQILLPQHCCPILLCFATLDQSNLLTQDRNAVSLLNLLVFR